MRKTNSFCLLKIIFIFFLPFFLNCISIYNFDKYSRYKKLTIIFTGDINGKLFPLKNSLKKSSKTEISTGGLTLLSAAINEIKQTCISQNRPFLIFDSGDMFNFSVFNDYANRNLLINFINSVDYDAIAIGNHEFDSGLINLIELSNNLKTQYVCANIKPLSNEKFIIENFSKNIFPYVIKETDSMKIGIIGIIDENLTNILPVQYRSELSVSPFKILKKIVNNLRSSGCHLIILLSHCGFDPKYPETSPDYKIAGEIKGVDLILSGHREKGISEPFQHPFTKTYICSNFGNGATITKIDLYIDIIKAEIMRFNHILLNVDSKNYSSDTTYIQKINDEISLNDNDLNENNYLISIKFARLNKNENINHRIIVECLRQSLSADCAILNKGFIRGKLNKNINNISDLPDIIPHNNFPVMFYIKNSELKSFTNIIKKHRDKITLSGLQFFQNSILTDNTNGRPNKDNNTLEPDKFIKIVMSDYCFENYFRNSNLAYSNFILNNQSIAETLKRYLKGKKIDLFFNKNINFENESE